MLSKLLSVKAAAAAVAGGLSLTTALAAAGALPAPVQDALAEAASHAGFSLPRSDEADDADRRGREHADDHADDHADERSSSSEVDHGRPADPGIEGKGAVVSDLARTTDATGVDKGAQISTVASDGRSRAGAEHPTGPSGDRPGVEVPPTGGTITADDASDGASHSDATTAGAASEGRSTAGPGNAGRHPSGGDHTGAGQQSGRP